MQREGTKKDYKRKNTKVFTKEKLKKLQKKKSFETYTKDKDLNEKTLKNKTKNHTKEKRNQSYKRLLFLKKNQTVY